MPMPVKNIPMPPYGDANAMQRIADLEDALRLMHDCHEAAIRGLPEPVGAYEKLRPVLASVGR